MTSGGEGLKVSFSFDDKSFDSKSFSITSWAISSLVDVVDAYVTGFNSQMVHAQKTARRMSRDFIPFPLMKKYR